MKKYTKEEKEGIIAGLAAFFVLFSIVIDPRVTIVIAFVISCILIWKASNK